MSQPGVHFFKTTLPFMFMGVFFILFVMAGIITQGLSPHIKLALGIGGLLMVLGMSSRYGIFDQKSFSILDSHNSLSAALIGAVVTYWLTQNLAIPVVIATSVVGLVGYYAAKFLTRYGVIDFSAVMYCGAFVGMVSAKVLPIESVAVAGLLSGFIFLLVANVFNGCGGKLGTIAFISCTLTVTSIHLFRVFL